MLGARALLFLAATEGRSGADIAAQGYYRYWRKSMYATRIAQLCHLECLSVYIRVISCAKLRPAKSEGRQSSLKPWQ